MITKKYLHSIFEYTNGELVWKVTRGPIKKGRTAGTINSRGYRHIRIDNKFYQAHRLIWIFFNDDLPSGMVVDHINRNREDNRIENLRLLSTSENNRNSIKSDQYNVGVWKVGHKYRASYRKDGVRYYIGTFHTESEAIAARQQFKETIA